ncbi:hypothetical protein ACFFJY_12345 [Fictibacillus aquaticus]|uniref:hypothetical protein n=1 Tax=Fictibacillus aquaticus TaxID=2021314 RepID=UPI0013FD4BF4|nr:hypothetical protein [Fictibacillus aquaticus]
MLEQDDSGTCLLVLEQDDSDSGTQYELEDEDSDEQSSLCFLMITLFALMIILSA